MQEIKTRRGRRDAWGPDSSFREFGEYVIAERIQKMLSYVKGVRRGTDPEDVHDMRVASRRLRAALDMFAPVFDDPGYERLSKAVKQVTEALSRARDLDVMLMELEREAAHTPPGQRGAVVEMIRDRSTERRHLQRNVVEALDRLVEQDLASMFAGIATEGREPEDGGDMNASEDSGTQATRRSARRPRRSSKTRPSVSSRKAEPAPSEPDLQDAGPTNGGDTAS